MDTADGGWMAVQRYKTVGEQNYLIRNGQIMKKDLGSSVGGKLRYRLKALNCFTESGQLELQVDFQLANRTWLYLHYKQFR